MDIAPVLHVFQNQIMMMMMMMMMMMIYDYG